MTNTLRQIREGYIATRDLIGIINQKGGSWIYSNMDVIRNFIDSMEASKPRALGRAAYCLIYPDQFSKFYDFLIKYAEMHSASKT